MFDIGWSELLLIGVVALIAIGPKELPGALRTLGQMMGKVRRMASEFQSQFHEAMREAEMADLKKEVDEMTAKAGSFANFDPLGDVGKDIEKSLGDLPPIDTPPAATPPEAQASAADLPAPETSAAAHANATAANAEPASVPPVVDEPVVAESAAVPAGADPPVEAAVAKPDAGKAPA